jgi:gluconate 2-dehydrogenase gamma chain
MEVAAVVTHEPQRALGMQPFIARRHFLLQSGLLSTATPLLIATGAMAPLPLVFAQSASSFVTLDSAMAQGLEAVAARILPEDATGPGALSGGVIYFIDRVLGTSRQEWQALLTEGMQKLDAHAAQAQGSSFAMLDAAQQDELLHSIEKSEFFSTMRTLTMAGMFALPEYGGNRDYAGWQLIGFQHHHVWQPPFGHYDADYMTRGE